MVRLQPVPSRAAGPLLGAPEASRSGVGGPGCVGEAEPIGCWGLAEIARLCALWHRFRAGEFDRQELQRRLIPLQARLGRLLRRGQETPDRRATALCRELTKWWPALWTFARVEGVEPTNNAAEQAI